MHYHLFNCPIKILVNDVEAKVSHCKIVSLRGRIRSALVFPISSIDVVTDNFSEQRASEGPTSSGVSCENYYVGRKFQKLRLPKSKKRERYKNGLQTQHFDSEEHDSGKYFN